MTLEELQDRKQQLDTAIINTNQSLWVLQGHKQEVEFQISELSKPEVAEVVASEDEIPVD